MDDFIITLEPTSALNTKSPYADVKETESGHLQIFDDTPGSEVIRTQHKSGSYTEIRPDGSEVHKIVGDGWQITTGNNRVIIDGFCQVTINGNSNLTVRGEVNQYIEGDHNTTINGDYNLVVKGKTNITSAQNMSIGVANPTGGKLKLLAGDSFVVNSDLVVNGGISGYSVYSTGSITAGTGIQAGVPGSLNPVAGISTLGGLNVGIPPPTPTIPGVVNATTLVTAPAVVGTVITYGGILMDPVGGAPTIRMVYDSHIHPVRFGPTGSPVQQLPLP